ncbi:uncharacterized protein LOC111345172 [Stylophora pistillata]|uniref:uncharacterized protein LOC111345172 n=1 Tax=Stylophora pistillata TaxID=50429 RepID=UPI000C04F5BB|nr:uncharacterized protein LOC111345172 [Stylophora pistillata]
MSDLIWMFTLFSIFTVRANCKAALATNRQIIVDKDFKSISVGVPTFGNITIKWLLGQPNFERIVIAMSNASNVIGRLKDGNFHCYNDGLFTKRMCREHFQLTLNGSGDLIIAITNLSPPFFGRFLISVYNGLDSEIDTLWFTVHEKAGTATPSTATSPTGVTSCNNETTGKPMATEATTPGTESKVIIGVSISVPIVGVAVLGCIFWCYCCHKRQRTKSAELLTTAEGVELREIISPA